jgi:hypothetical protein
MGEQMNRILIWRLLNEARKNLTKLNQINIEAIPYSNVKEYARLLVNKKQQGYSRIELSEFGLMKEESEFMDEDDELKDIQIADLTEIFSKIEEIHGTADFDLLLKESGLKKDFVFAPLNESLAAKRAQLEELLKQEITVPGFPIKIIPGKLNIIIAPSHTGKTVYGTGLALNFSRIGRKTLFLSTEEDEMAFIERTKYISAEDKGFVNLTYIDHSKFSPNILTNILMAAEAEGYEYVVIDYLKKSMWDNYTSDHVVMEQINTTIIEALGAMKRKITVFAFVQANRAAYDKKYATVKDIQTYIDDIAIMVDGGVSAYRNADNVIFLKNDRTISKRFAIVAKSRRQNIVGAAFEYDVNLENFYISQGLIHEDSQQVKSNTPKSYGKI